jgi:hypothetical protein
MTGGYVVTRPLPGSNVGSNLASLAGAVHLADRLQRRLVVDWRGMSQLQDKTINYFSEFFDTPAEILGVPVLYAPVEGLDYAAEGGSTTLTANAACAAMRSELDVTGSELLFLEEYHGADRLYAGTDDARFSFLRRFYHHVRPGRELAALVDGWADEHLGGRFVVGVNIRTGNGSYFGPGQRYAGRVDVAVLEDGERLLRVLERAVGRRTADLPKPLRSSAVTFHATDSEPMSRLLSRLPNSATRRQTFPPPNTGDLYSFDGSRHDDRASVVDTLADMFLLARCDALVYNNSMFNQYARVLTGYYGGNLVHLETLFLKPRLRQLAAVARRRML